MLRVSPVTSERQFDRKRAICHPLTKGSGPKAGPSLTHLFGHQVGKVADYANTDAINGFDIIWTAKTINDLFDLGPDHYIPGTKIPMQRIAKESDRSDLVDYLRTATVQGEN